ncbi:DegT/DnrJ/EryC1/StrS family aminotransferase [Agrobacterium cavarae]|uniref:DegT/DnrJ/EryC1/StrS family aminotransferase n=1 Tax=Agrobacterium cavarae TaxID=2528239 RepID=UPI003FD699E0
MIPFLDLGASYRELEQEIDAAIKRVLTGGWYILGEEVARFESEYADYCSSAEAVGVANGLDALVLSLRVLGVGSGDEVIVPSNTFIATWLAVSAVGALPVPVEPNPETHNLEASKVVEAITEKTKAIIAVHLYGQPADLDEIKAVAARANLFLIEDAAQAHGARYKGKRIGAHGDAVCWSFYPAKNLGAFGDGGAVTTDNSEIASRLRILRNYGSKEKYLNEVQGMNSRLDPIHAAVLSVKLKYLDEWNARRKQIAARYLAELQIVDVVLPVVPAWADPVWHLFVIRTKDRAGLQRRLYDIGVSTQIHYPLAPSQQKAYAGVLDPRLNLSVAAELAGEVLSLPIGPHQTDEQTSLIIKGVLEAAR